MSTRFFTSHGNQSLLQKFQWVFRTNRDIECFDVLDDCLRVSGYFAIQPALEHVPLIRLLTGGSPDTVVAAFRHDIETAAYRQDIEAGILRFIEDVASGKIQWRTNPSMPVRTNLYIARPRRFGEKNPGAVIAGPTSLTGGGAASDYQLNVLLYNFDDVRFASEEFARWWKEAVPVPSKSLQEVRDATHLSRTVTPQEVYWKLLAHYFGPNFEYDPKCATGLFLHQIDAINLGCRLLETHNGCLLADVAGMDKPMLATLIAKKSGAPGTLIVCPPVAEEDWQWAAQKCGLDNVRLVAGKNLSTVTDLDRYDVVIAADDCQIPAGKKVVLVGAAFLPRPASAPDQNRCKNAAPTIIRCNHTDLWENEPYRKNLEARRIQLPKVKKLRAIYYPATGPGDPKFDRFLACLKTELFSGINNSGKLVVFSESKATTDALAAALAQSGYRRVLTVDTANRHERLPVVQANFDASVPDKERANDYDILITTELLAARVNLHRANVIVNYDLPTTAARLQQRLNRINCLGITAPKLYIYNLFPTDPVTGAAELRQSAITHLRALHAALGPASEIYMGNEPADSFGLFEHAHEDGERDDTLRLLTELRLFRQQNPDGFRRVQNLPLRTRVCRADNSRAGQTVVVIRDPHRVGYYRVKADGIIEEIALLEAAGDLRVVDAREGVLPLPDTHHQHVSTALARFPEPSAAIVLSESFDHPVRR